MREEQKIRGEKCGVSGWVSPIPLRSAVTFSLGPLSATLPQNTSPTHRAGPVSLVLFIFLQNLLTYYIVHLLSLLSTS